MKMHQQSDYSQYHLNTVKLESNTQPCNTLVTGNNKCETSHGNSDNQVNEHNYYSHKVEKGIHPKNVSMKDFFSSAGDDTVLDEPDPVIEDDGDDSGSGEDQVTGAKGGNANVISERNATRADEDNATVTDEDNVTGTNIDNAIVADNDSASEHHNHDEEGKNGSAIDADNVCGTVIQVQNVDGPADDGEQDMANNESRDRMDTNDAMFAGNDNEAGNAKPDIPTSKESSGNVLISRPGLLHLIYRIDERSATPLTFPCKCIVCGQEFGCKSKLNIHTWNNCMHSTGSNHSKELPPLCKCEVCGKTFSCQAKLNMHSRKHGTSNLKPSGRSEKQLSKDSKMKPKSGGRRRVRPYKCQICSRRFKRESDLEAHNVFHTGETPYKCSFCYKEFETMTEIKAHYKTHKDGVAKYMCSVCGNEFTRLHNLRKHIVCHTGERPHECTICGKRFANVSALTEHSHGHAEEKLFSCAVCDKRFFSERRLKYHMTMTHLPGPKKVYSKTGLCTECGKTFPNPSRLSAHIKTHLPPEERISKPIECPVCGKVLSRASTLKAHMVVHRGEPSICPVCGKSFKHRHSMRNHERAYHEGKGKTCGICGRFCMTNFQMKTHMKTHTK